MLSLHLPNVFPQSSKFQNQRTPVKPKVKRKNDDIPCKARRKAKRALGRAKSIEATSSEASAGMVGADLAAVISPDMMAINTPAPLHSAEMADISTTSAAVSVASHQPSFVPVRDAVMADPTQLFSADTVDTAQLSSAEMVNVTPAKSFVMKDKPLESTEKFETASPFPKSAEKVEATTSQIKKCATPSTTDTVFTERLNRLLDKLEKLHEDNKMDAETTACMNAYIANHRAKKELETRTENSVKQEINERKTKS